MNAPALRVKPIIIVLAAGLPAYASPWMTPSGSGEHFTYANGQDLNGLFGEPTVVGDSFIFPGLPFTASAADGTSDSRSDVVSVDLLANPGWMFGLTRITAFGSYAVTGEGSVDVEGAVSFRENVTGGREFVGPLTTNPSFPLDSGTGGWSGLSVIDITFEFPSPADMMHVEFGAGVMAISGPGGSAFIDFHGQDRGAFTLDIGMFPVPEPGSLALVACAALLTAGVTSGRSANKKGGVGW